MRRIHADLNELTIDESRVQLNLAISEEENVKQGERVLLYSPRDFEVEAILEKVWIEDRFEIWYGILDWDTYRDLPYPGNETQNPE
jgi:hypothetical protein